MRRLTAALARDARSRGRRGFSAPPGHADTPWFAPQVGNATQVLSVGTGRLDGQDGSSGSVARPAGSLWMAVSDPDHVGSAGLGLSKKDTALPRRWASTARLCPAFGTQPSPQVRLKYQEPPQDYWWSAEGPTYNTTQCASRPTVRSTPGPAARRTPTSRLRTHAIIMVLPERIPGDGGVLRPHHQRRGDGRMRRPRRRHVPLPGQDHPLAAARRA